MSTAAAWASDQVAGVLDDPAGRRALLASLYRAQPGDPEHHLPYRRAALAFMDWQLRRGVLEPADADRPGSAWWRAVNERLLLDTGEARAHLLGQSGSVSSASAALSLAFAERPSVRSWYRAHNATIATAYLDHRDLAEAESRVERFFINLILLRVLYAHALVAAPRLALGPLAPIARLLGDPRLGMTGIFLSLSRVVPDRYPLTDDLQIYLDGEQGIGRLLDLGLALPRLPALFAWSASELSIPELTTLVDGQVPAYAWDPSDAAPWDPPPRRIVRVTRRLLPAPPPD